MVAAAMPEVVAVAVAVAGESVEIQKNLRKFNGIHRDFMESIENRKSM